MISTRTTPHRQYRRWCEPEARSVIYLPLPAKHELTFFIILKHRCPALTPRTLIRDLMPTSRPGRRGRGGCRRPPYPTRHGSNVFIVVYRALESRAVGVLVGIEQGVGHTDKIVVVCCTRI
jgi:hypothetical protein